MLVNIAGSSISKAFKTSSMGTPLSVILAETIDARVCLGVDNAIRNSGRLIRAASLILVTGFWRYHAGVGKGMQAKKVDTLRWANEPRCDGMPSSTEPISDAKHWASTSHALD